MCRPVCDVPFVKWDITGGVGGGGRATGRGRGPSLRVRAFRLGVPSLDRMRPWSREHLNSPLPGISRWGAGPLPVETPRRGRAERSARARRSTHTPASGAARAHASCRSTGHAPASPAPRAAPRADGTLYTVRFEDDGAEEARVTRARLSLRADLAMLAEVRATGRTHTLSLLSLIHI